MADRNDRKVRYRLSDQDDLKFVIENYNRAKPFSNFFPGIAGLMGIPMWCFYVNRGQAVCSFGTDSKDGAIMEFQPANKAYGQVSTHGFRTFLKYAGGKREGFYEPFNDNQANLRFKLHNRMIISPWDLCIEERNDTLGLTVRAECFTIPEEPVAGLARMITITNLKPEAIRLELLDGLPLIMPYGMWDFYMKNMSRTIEAWALVENLERKAPYYRLKVNAEDGPEVVRIKEGNFYTGFCDDQYGTRILEPIIDPALIFGPVRDMSYPAGFLKKDFYIPEEQCPTSRTGSAMGYIGLELAGNESRTLCSIFGHAKSLDNLNGLIGGFLSRQFFENKAVRNEEIVREIMDRNFVNSGSKVFNSYCRQTFLDNVLRGGFPISLEAAGKRSVFHAYSRRHGDPERDYNSFKIMPTTYSQGNGAYRDINQNRRNDAWFNPDVGRSNILYFLNLIRLDGYNPLIVKGVSYQYNPRDNGSFLLPLVDESKIPGLLEFLGKTFLPSTLLSYINEKKIVLKVPVPEFVNAVILNSSVLEEAEHGEGFWTDHWHYNLDLLESYEALYPDGMAALLGEERLFSFYKDEYIVVPRKERYVLYNGRPRQLNCVRKDERGPGPQAPGESGGNKVRVRNGTGGIYTTSLWTKLLCICVNKIATLDAFGTGIEMEAGKPNWNDAVNGLPSFFGSSASETFEIKRLILLLQEWLTRDGLKNNCVKMPVELYWFMNGILEALNRNAEHCNGGYNGTYNGERNGEYNREYIGEHGGKQTGDADRQSGWNCFQYWEESNSLKEAYREKIRYGLDGHEESIDAAYIGRFLNAALARVEMGIRKAFDPIAGIYQTYFINEPVEYKVLPAEEDEMDGKTGGNGFGAGQVDGAGNAHGNGGGAEAGEAVEMGAGNSAEADKPIRIQVKKFRQVPLPPFLEGQVHALRTEKDADKVHRLYDAVLQSELYDEELGMYKTNASLREFPMELGRIRAFSPGWLENESIFLHMEYKYLLELLKSGLADEFYKDCRTALVPFMEPEVYGRSIFENSSFIASSVNPDRNMRGCGFVARLSGTTAEFCNMLLVMATGVRPFYLNTLGEPELRLSPMLPGWIFTKVPTQTRVWIRGTEKEITLEPDTYSCMLFGSVLLVYHNELGRDTYGATAARTTKIIITGDDGRRAEFAGDSIPAPYASAIRMGICSRIDAMLS